MTDILPHLKDLISAPGLSGHEKPVHDLIAKAWRHKLDDLQSSRLGSLHGVINGQGEAPRPKILFAAHMDAVGLMVTSLQDGLLRITDIGGVDPRILPGQFVIVHGREDLPGMITKLPYHLLPDDMDRGQAPLEALLVDTGLSAEAVDQQVRIGDLISFAQPPIEMPGEILIGHSLDNRASVAALTHAIRVLGDRSPQWDVWFGATVQEEESYAGGYTTAFELRPDLAVVVDVTYARGPETPKHQSFELEKGPTLGWGPNIHPGLFRAFKELAETLEIPYQVEILPRHSETEAFAMQVTAEGIPTMVISIPLRYMHTPVEMIAIQDVTRTGRLLAEFAAGLKADFMETLVWDE
jgi:endoglucanase